MLFDAIEFAARAHREHYRKGTRIPYIAHLISVAKILIEYDCAEEIIVAGLLHDTVEDTSVTLEDIRKSFGEKVASLVEAASEPDKSDTWENRKRHTIEYLKTAPMDVLLLSCADKLDNIRSIKEDYERFGEVSLETLPSGQGFPRMVLQCSCRCFYEPSRRRTWRYFIQAVQL